MQKIPSGNGKIDRKKLVNMHFLILQSISFLLMYKLAWEQFETHKLLSHGLWAMLWISSPWDAKIGSHVHIRPWDRSTFLDIGSQIAPELVCISNFSIDLKSPEKPCYHAQFDQCRQELRETRCSLSEAFFGHFPCFSRFEIFKGIVPHEIVNKMIAIPASQCQEKWKKVKNFAS